MIRAGAVRGVADLGSLGNRRFQEEAGWWQCLLFRMNCYILVHMECIVQKANWKRVLDEIKRWGRQKLLAVVLVNLKINI